MLRSICILILILHSYIIEAQNSFFIYFDFDSFQLTEKSLQSVSEIAQIIKNEADADIEIIGHTDQDGDIAYNQLLSELRAKCIFNALLNAGIPSNQMSYSFYGEELLLSSAQDDKSKAKNRRVEVKFHIPTYEDITQLMEQVNSKHVIQEYQIINEKETQLKGKEGTKIKVPPSAFLFPDGSEVKGSIVIKLIEAFDFQSFASHNLSCYSNDQLLESGGMINISAHADGKSLILKDGKNIEILYPASQVKEGMQIFYAESNIEKDGVDNWITSNSNVKISRGSNQTIPQLDLSELVEFRISMVNKPKNELTKVTKKPSFPEKPYRPNKPIEPSIDKISLSLNKWQKLTWSENKIEQHKKDIYNSYCQKYAEDFLRYETRMLEYEESLLKYNELSQRTRVAIENWYEECRLKYAEAYNSYRVKSDFQFSKDLWVSHALFLKSREEIGEEQAFIALYDAVTKEDKQIYFSSLLEYTFGPNFMELLQSVPNISKHRSPVEHSQAYKDALKLKTMIKKVGRRYALKNKENISANDIGSYSLAVTKLGWINCDRFILIPEENKREIAIKSSKDAAFYLVFHDLNSMITAKKAIEGYSFTGIPKDQSMTLVGIKLKENKPYLFAQELSLNNDVSINPVFTKSSLDEIDALFQQLDKGDKG